MTPGTPAPGSTPPRVIEITVSPTGESRLETRGFAGATCRDASRTLERALGLVETDQPTAEFHHTPSAVTHQAQST